MKSVHLTRFDIPECESVLNTRRILETQQQQKGLYYVPETDLDAGKYSRNKIESILELMAFTSNKHKQTAVTDMKKKPKQGHETEGGWNGC